MPALGQFPLPRRTRNHRIACKALYRALLEQCPHIPLPTDISFPGKVNPIKHFIRKRFQQNKDEQSPRLVAEGLRNGYAAEKLLFSAAIGNTSSINQIHNILHTLHASAITAREVCAKPTPRLRPRVWPYPGAGKVLDIRPLPKSELGGTGIRNVPSLSTASNVPFLRFKGSEISPYLSRVLGDKIDQRLKRRLRIEEYEKMQEMGEGESEWDILVERQGWMEGIEIEGAVDTDFEAKDGEWKDWGWEFGRAMRKVYEDSNRDFDKAHKMANRMIKIVEEEKKMAAEEKVERLQMRNEMRLERKQEREEVEKVVKEKKKEETKSEWEKLTRNIDGLAGTKIVVK